MNLIATCARQTDFTAKFGLNFPSRLLFAPSLHALIYVALRGNAPVKQQLNRGVLGATA